MLALDNNHQPQLSILAIALLAAYHSGVSAYEERTHKI